MVVVVVVGVVGVFDVVVVGVVVVVVVLVVVVVVDVVVVVEVVAYMYVVVGGGHTPSPCQMQVHFFIENDLPRSILAYTLRYIKNEFKCLMQQQKNHKVTHRQYTSFLPFACFMRYLEFLYSAFCRVFSIAVCLGTTTANRSTFGVFFIIKWIFRSKIAIYGGRRPYYKVLSAR